MKTVHILSVSGNHSETTKENFLTLAASRGARAEFKPSRLGGFDVVKVNGQPVARAFESAAAMFLYQQEVAS